MRVYGPRYDEALAFANASHRGQVRKGNGAPYVTHVLAVSSLVGEYGGDEDQVIAALLHDVVEDCGVSFDELRRRFGDRVAAIVELCTDTMVEHVEADAAEVARVAALPHWEKPKAPWKARKEHHIAKLRRAGADTKLVVAADKLHNAMSIARDLRRPEIGEAVWKRFKAGRDEAIWYLREMTAALRDGWHNDILDELEATVSRIAAHGTAAP